MAKTGKVIAEVVEKGVLHSLFKHWFLLELVIGAWKLLREHKLHKNVPGWWNRLKTWWIRQPGEPLTTARRFRSIVLPIALYIGWWASPLDLLPDFIPVLGWVDDLFINPWACWKLRQLGLYGWGQRPTKSSGRGRFSLTVDDVDWWRKK